jgi:predicted small lipoprotein YifL
MPVSLSLAARVLVLAGGLAVALSACGRRGPLQPPPDASVATSAPAAQGSAPDPDERPAGTLPSPTPTPTGGKRPRGFIVPDKPFILDPLL